MKYVFIILAILITVGAYFLGDFIGDYYINKSLFKENNKLNASQLKLISEKIAEDTKFLVAGRDDVNSYFYFNITQFQNKVFLLLQKVENEKSISYVNGSINTPKEFNDMFSFYSGSDTGEKILNVMMTVRAINTYEHYKRLNLKKEQVLFYYFMEYLLEALGIILCVSLFFLIKKKGRLFVFKHNL